MPDITITIATAQFFIQVYGSLSLILLPMLIMRKLIV